MLVRSLARIAMDVAELADKPNERRRKKASLSAKPVANISVTDAVEQFLSAKRAAGYRASYVVSLRQVLHQFAEFDGCRRGSVQESGRQVQQFVASRKWCPSAQRGNIGRLASFFTYARKQGWVSANPCDRMEMPRVEAKCATVLTREQLTTAIRWTVRKEPRYVAFLALAALCGVRPDEICRLPWNAIDLAKRTLTVDASVSKIHRRRKMPLPPKAHALLVWARAHGSALPVTHVSRRRFLRRLREVLGMKVWPQDVLRHTAATALLEKHQDAGKVAHWLGNSERILTRNYIG